ncbi:MAG: hypothetical protein WCR20_20550, partial [Verrucomicrobiota bacterium]
PKLVKITLKLADNAKSMTPREPITRIVSLPSVIVQAMWQKPMIQPIPGQPGARPAPGQLPGQVPGQLPGAGEGVNGIKR